MKLYLLLLGILSFGNYSFAGKKKPLVVTFQLEGWAKPAESSFYVDLIDAVSQVTNTPIELQVLPTARAVANYSRNIADCFLGGDWNAVRIYLDLKDGERGSFVFSDPIMKISYVVYNLKSNPPISKFEDLSQKRIGVVLGINLEHLGLSIAPDWIVTAENYYSLVNMLRPKRIDAFVEVNPYPKTYAGSFHHDPSYVLNKGTEHLNCHNRKANRDLIATFNKGLKELKESKKLAEILNRHFTP